MTNRSQPTHGGPALRALITFLSLAYLGVASQLMGQAIGDGLNAVEGGQISASTGTPYYTDTLWADTGNFRWMMANHGAGTGLPVAAWPCVTQGCIVYAGTPQIASLYWTETSLAIGTAGAPLIVGSGVPQWASFSFSTITGLTNTSGTKLATSTGTLNSGNFAKIYNSSGDYGDSLIATNSVAAADATVGDGGTWSNGTPGGFGYPNTTNTTPTNSIMYAHQLYLRWPQVIGHSTVRVVTGGSSETLYTCLYNAAGTTLLWSANIAVNTSAANASATATQYTANPGTYMLAYEQTGTTAAAILGFNTSSGVFNLRNANATRDATTGNLVGAGVCPSSLGTLTASTTVNDIMILLEP